MKTTHTLSLASLLATLAAIPLDAQELRLPLSTAVNSISPTADKTISTTETETLSDTIPSIELDDLEVVAMRKVIQSDGAKLSYNMEEDKSSIGLSLSDALRKVPMVTVDGEGNVKINGQGNFKIYLNGKEDSSLEANYKEIFKAMPANSVLKVEVITEPGAKYDAEGTAGILNLVTISRNVIDGFSTSVNAYFSKRESGISLYGRLKSGRLSISGDFNYVNGRYFKQDNWNETHIVNYASEEARYQYNRLNQRIIYDFIGGGLNLSYDLSDNDLITANANVRTMRGYLVNGGRSFYSVHNADNELVGSMTRNLYGRLINTSLNAGASWEHSFKREGEKVVLSYLFNHGYDILAASLDKSEAEGAEVISPYEYTSNRGYNNEHTVQIDYVKPLGSENHSLDAGGKGIFRRNPALSYTLWQKDQTIDEALPGDISDMVQKQDIYALYAVYNGTFGHFTSTAGLRYEHTRMGIDFKKGDSDDFINHLNDLVPNAAIAFNFDHTTNLRLAYQMRISRPSLKQVNPYKFIYYPSLAEMGNPDLRSERANKITLTFSSYGRLFGGNVGLDFSSIANAISPYSFTENDVTYSTYANIGSNRSIALFGFFNWSPTQRLQISANGRLTRTMLSSPNLNLSNAGWTVNYGGNINYSFPCKINFYIYGGQSTRTYYLQGWQDGWYYYGLGVNRSFLKDDALTLTLYASDFLKSQTRNSSFTATENMTNHFSFYNRNWNVGFEIAWRFGNLKSDVKKASKSIENDDKSTVAGTSAM